MSAHAVAEARERPTASNQIVRGELRCAQLSVCGGVRCAEGAKQKPPPTRVRYSCTQCLALSAWQCRTAMTCAEMHRYDIRRAVSPFHVYGNLCARGTRRHGGEEKVGARGRRGP
eukprot:53360-Prymnesium_polylepis.1